MTDHSLRSSHHLPLIERTVKTLGAADTTLICGYDVEDSEQFLLHCPLYHIQRQEMIQSIINVEIEADDINEDLLLFGSEFYSREKIFTVFAAVHKYISDAGRL